MTAIIPLGRKIEQKGGFDRNNTNRSKKVTGVIDIPPVVQKFSNKFLLTNPHKTKTERKSKGSRRKRKRDSRAEEKLLQSNILSGEIVSPENAKIVKPQSDS